ncbi:MAG: aminotransferase class V-fold PLP-dependent enzyme [Proteobacteria bacterium]|nr:aminotransferase class V-fold PLP-dependent enzyme [Pseudomonadota bacterium]MCP4921056.1 aminotransferase class V-fold PLP-dependent enzyme [Pseudomonadota bacterium]
MLTRRSMFGLLAASPALLTVRHARAEPQGEYLLPDGQAYFNTGTLGASPRAVIDAMARDLAHVEETLAEWNFPKGAGQPPMAGYRPDDAVRAKLGAMFNVHGQDVALTRNATMGMNFLAHGLDLKPGDEVLITDQEHPGGRTGWDLRSRRDGIVVREVAVDLDSPDAIATAFEGAWSPQVRVVAVPHITSRLGLVLPVHRLAGLARDRGALCVIDGAQAPGQLVVDIAKIGCHAYFSSPHKWLLAPKGTGFLWIAPELQDRLWTTLASTQWDNREDGAFRFMQLGTGNRSLVVGLEAALDWWTGLQPAQVQAHGRSLADRLREGLVEQGATVHSPTHPDLAGSMVTWSLGGDTRALMNALWDQERIRVRAVEHDTQIRQCCHLYNTLEQVERTLAWVRRQP